jgi:hypothetical protein
MVNNVERVATLNQKFKSLTDPYFVNLNSCVFKTQKQGEAFIIPVTTVADVKINMLSFPSTIDAIGFTTIENRERVVQPVRPLVRVQIMLELFKEWYDSEDYFKSSIASIITDVQKQWEKNFGSFKNTRWGDDFLACSGFRLADDYVYMDFYGNWASNKDV